MTHNSTTKQLETSKITTEMPNEIYFLTGNMLCTLECASHSRDNRYGHYGHSTFTHAMATNGFGHSTFAQCSVYANQRVTSGVMSCTGNMF